MPATNPRITITLQPSVHAILRRMSELTGNSQSAIVGDLLAESSSIFERMVRILEAAEKLKQQGRAVGEEFKESLNSAQANMEAQLGLVLETMDDQEGTLLSLAEVVERRRSPAARHAQAAKAGVRKPSTPISNRGVTPHPKGQQVERKVGRKGKGGRS